ncbi:type II toxin-antitoxin system death-on-curing family toxin [Methylobacterium sp. E-016]|uniref:type II toxin-antitoxin system death-on-curing family toxin n=1 Tax=Methylobacterium sp. E-016 TaxID=2836556 RepID=UPI002443BF26|nr:type II toxin-antitoxin system death-on-curing family toxin [Methylobacterium sp. E-016]MCJ2074487.1 type II toxin-antitoxin system death-on-curing family toxin [Methylobacterium sp. E-016]
MEGDPEQPIWFSPDQIERLNEMVVAETGENHLVLSHDLLAGAMARPVNLFLYEAITDIIVLGVRLIEALGKNHCFQQGNKRTAFVAGIAFMRNNGVQIDLADKVENADLIERLITGEASAEDVVARCRAARMAA